jgi:histidine triad (HIT) family protein
MAKENKESKKEDCIFCKIINGEIKAEKIDENDNFIAIYDAFPQVKNHVLILTKKHFRGLLETPSTLGTEMLDFAKKIALNMIKEGKAEGFNLVINTEAVAGQAVFHTHIHILPRKSKDEFKIFYKEGKSLD